MQVADTSFSPSFMREQAFSKEILIVHSSEFPFGGLNTLRLPSLLVKNVSVYGAVVLDLILIQNLLDRCFKRKYTSNRMDFRELLEKADKKLFKVRPVDPDVPYSNIIPKKKETKYHLRNKTAHRPQITTDRFNNVFVNRLIFRYNL